MSDAQPPQKLGLPAGRIADPYPEPPRSLGRDAWQELVHKPMFIVSGVLLAMFSAMALFPGVLTFKPIAGPGACLPEMARQGPSLQAWFGYDSQGCDIYTRTVYGARASMAVGIFTTLAVLLVGGAIGTWAGYRGKWADAVLSRTADIFFGIPLLLGSMLVLVSFPSDENTPQWMTIGKVILALAALGWPQQMRIMRSSVIQVKSSDYVHAAVALGASGSRVIRRHIVPNALGPVIVVATIALGGYIGAEATLSFLGIGLQPPVVSWGVMISQAQGSMRTSPHMLLFPAVALSLCVLAFIMLGDAVREALDPKLR
jgi:oligopeptide transport system permease protein